MIFIPQNIFNQIIKHSEKEFPNEACGILAGKKSGVEKAYAMTNIDKSHSTFFMDAKEQLRVMKEIRNLGLEMVGIYHSHPLTQAYPSADDVELAFYPDVSYVIVSLKEMGKPSLKSFKIKEGKISEEEVKIE